MVIHLPGTTDDALDSERLTPKTIVHELDKYIVGQNAAKRAVAVALRNRWRRQQLAPELRDEIAPKNIIMIGPTGVGKTEIARRLARLTRSPFLKIEASKFTEVGYVGRDVESIIRDLTEISVKLVRDEKARLNRDAAIRNARERILDILLPDSRRPAPRPARADLSRSPAIRARNSAAGSTRASSRSARSRSTSRNKTTLRSKFSRRRASRRWASTSKTCCPDSSAENRDARRCVSTRRARS